MKVYTLLSCLLLTIISYGQINKGSILLGGDVGISRTSLEQKASGGIVYSEEYSRLFLNPKMGIFVSKNVALGVGLGLLNTEQKQTDRMDPRNQAFKGSTTIKTRFINPFVNFQKKIADRVLFSFELDARIGKGESTYLNSGSSDLQGEINFFEFNISPGIYYLTTKKTALTLNYGNFRYNNSKEIVDLSSRGGSEFEINNNEIGFNFGLESLELGFVFIFRKKEE